VTTSRISRIVVALATLLFATVALGFWVTPDQLAQRFGLVTAGAAGLVTLRADFAGLFAGMAVLSAVAAWTARKSWCYAGAVILAAIAFGRAISWIENPDAIDNDLPNMAIEIVVILALIGLARGSMPAVSTVVPRESR